MFLAVRTFRDRKAFGITSTVEGEFSGPDPCPVVFRSRICEQTVKWQERK